MAYDPDWLIELFEPFGSVHLKRMFSDHGVYSGEHCVALAIKPGLCLRVDAETRDAFEAAGAVPFTYGKQGKTITVQKWWRMPDAFLDDPQALAPFVRLSLGTALSLPPPKPRKPRAKRGTAGRAA